MQQYFAKSRINDAFLLDKDDFHHIRNVMRFNIDDKVLVSYDNALYVCSLQLENERYIAKIIEKLDEKRELPCDITLICGMPKIDKFELILQKSTELGVKRIVPFISDRCVVKISDDRVDKKIERWQKIAKEAAEQCHRLIIPEITKPIYGKDIDSYLGELNLCADECNRGQTGDELMANLRRKPASVTVIVGPEGGFSPEEFALFRKLGFLSISLGKRILRSETAVMYFLSVIGFILEN